MLSLSLEWLGYQWWYSHDIGRVKGPCANFTWSSALSLSRKRGFSCSPKRRSRRQDRHWIAQKRHYPGWPISFRLALGLKLVCRCDRGIMITEAVSSDKVETHPKPRPHKLVWNSQNTGRLLPKRRKCLQEVKTSMLIIYRSKSLTNLVWGKELIPKCGFNINIIMAPGLVVMLHTSNRSYRWLWQLNSSHHPQDYISSLSPREVNSRDWCFRSLPPSAFTPCNIVDG